MRILDRYIGKTLLRTTLIALLVLMAIFAFFSLIDQLEETGRGHYGLLQAIEYVVLTMPRLACELFPIAAVIGSMAAIGLLIRSGELTVIRAAGVSQLRIAYALCKTGLLLALITVVIGELVAPICEQAAQHRRSIALTEQIALKTKYGFWSRDGHSYINIRKILPGDRIEDIYIYEFDEEDRLFSSTYAREAEYTDEQWLLHDIVQTRLSEDKATSYRMKLAAWDALLNPEMINLVTIKPDYLSFWGLVSYIGYLSKNGQNSQLYEQALWSKIINPFSIIAMILLALPIVRRGSQIPAVGQKIFIGALIGIIFHTGNQVAGHLGV
ncbi:MAG: LPS export ABC transporter permease LptG, partial [Gammaproteobacteria bacterium RBG_16_51_14]